MRRYDFAIIGAGVAGLMIAKKLADLGADIVVLEQHERIGAEASTRNGGYVHAGGFHAASISDENLAIRTAHACMRGADRLRAEFPEAMIDAGGKIHLLFVDKALAELAEQRWQMSSVKASIVGESELQRRYPALAEDRRILGAAVEDFAIDTRIVLLKLMKSLVSQNVAVVRSAKDIRLVDGYIHYRLSQQDCSVRCNKVVYSIGAAAAGHAIRQKLGLLQRPRHVTLWKSHVLVAPEIPHIGFMFVDRGEVSVTPQNGYSVVCTRGDEIQIDEPDYLLDRGTVMMNSIALSRALPRLSAAAPLRAHCCLKVSISDDINAGRNVSFDAVWISDVELLALPGKFTTAPLLGDLIAQMAVSSGLKTELVNRPGDSLLVEGIA